VLHGCAGFSAAEAATVIAATAVLSAATAPAITDYIEDARLIRARHDVAMIAVSLIRLGNDVRLAPSAPGHWAAYDLLVGAGPAPRAATRDATRWTRPETLDDVGLLDDHLITNAAGYEPYRSRDGLGWRGAYLQKPVGADPWGHRYAVNVGVARNPRSDVLVISSGSDGAVTAPFDADGLPSGGDDIVAVVSSGGGGR
jgi:hypothetical protein